MLRNKQVKLGNKISFVVAHGTRNANSKKKIHQKAGFNRIPNSKKLDQADVRLWTTVFKTNFIEANEIYRAPLLFLDPNPFLFNQPF